MTPRTDPPPPIVPVDARPLTRSPAAMAEWNRRLNREHAMAALRARGGRLVRAVEARRRRLVAAQVLRGPHERVVDAGCEDGWVAEGYARRVRRLVLVDVDGEALARAPLAGRAGVRTLVADVTDAEALARHLPPASADVVVLSALLEHLPRPAAAFEALAPLLAPGGRFVVFVPADGPILALKAVLRRTGLGRLVRGLSLAPAPGHLRRFDRRGLGRVLRRAGRILHLAFDPAVLGYVAVVRPGEGEGPRCAV